jgi:arylsulfatase A-like enzyme
MSRATPLLLAFAIGCGGPREKVGALSFDGPVPPNLLWITLDTARVDHLGHWSGDPSVSPNLDAVLAGSVVLEDHRSCSNWTSPSFTCLLTGRSQLSAGFWTSSGDPAVPDYPPVPYATLALLLAERGYATTLVTSNEMFSIDFTGVARGFERQVDVNASPAPEVAAAALGEVGTLMAGDRPWYLHVHFLDPHGMYCAPAADVDLPAHVDLAASCDDSYRDDASFSAADADDQAALASLDDALYTGEIRYWDESFGSFWRELLARGALDDALVVFATDHGQQLFERGGHGHGLYLGSEENRAVAAFWSPHLAPLRWEAPTTHEDVAATLFALYDLAPPWPVDGVVVGDAPDDRALPAMNYRAGEPVLLSVVQGGRQLVYDWAGNRSFYRLDSDPRGLEDVYDAADPDVLATWDALAPSIAQVERTWPHLGPPAPP